MSTESASSGDASDIVAIIIRSGMQAFSDQKIACSRKWTILQLKEHLNRELSFKPEVAHQRLIYSGHFLDNARTIDSVLSGGGSGVATESADPTAQVFLLVYMNKVAMVSTPVPNTSDLRHRTSAATLSNGGASPLLTAGQGAQPFAQQNYAEYYAAYYQNYMNHMSQVMQQQFMAATGGSQQPFLGSPAGNLFNNGQFPLTPGVPMGWPQMAGGFAAMAPPQFAGLYPAALAVTAQHANTAAVAAQGAGVQPAVVLQAHGVVAARPPAGENAAAADGVRNRLDFLELVYKAFRFLLLATLIYGYSSFERLLAVVLAIVLLWFVRNQREVAANAANAAIPQRPPNLPRPEAAPAEANLLIDANANQPAADAIDANGAVPPTPGADAAAVPFSPPPPSTTVRTNAWTLAWSTVCSFFTSLVPEHHVAIE